MKVNVVGTSCTWFKRKNTSFIIDDKIVFDTPSGAYKDIIMSTDIENISTIIISHFHSDHFADIHIFATKFMRELKDISKKKRIYAPKGVINRIIDLNKVLCASEDELSAECLQKNTDFIEIYDGFEFKIENYKVTAYSVCHGDLDAYGFVFEDENKNCVGFSADTCMCESLHKILERSNYAFVEMAAIEKTNKHLTIFEVEELIKQYPNCKIYPVHTSDRTQKYAEDNNMNFLHDGQVLKF